MAERDIWLKALGMSSEEGRLKDHWRDLWAGKLANVVTFAQRPGMRTGDRIVLHAAGWQVVYGAGEVTSMPYLGGDPAATRWPWYVNIKLEHAIEWLHDGVPIDWLNDGRRDLRVVIRRRSHIRLTRAEYENAVAALSR